MPHARTMLALAIAAALAISACGEDEKSGGGGGGGDEQAAVEQAATAYIVEQGADDDDSEQPDSVQVDSVDVDGDNAEVKASSSATGNKYEVTLAKSGEDWVGQSLFKDVPSEPVEEDSGGGGGDPSSGAGELRSTDDAEKQIETSLLKPLGLEGTVECPPEVRLRRGNNFECKVTGDQNATVTVTQKDDKGSLNYKVNVER